MLLISRVHSFFSRRSINVTSPSCATILPGPFTFTFLASSFLLSPVYLVHMSDSDNDSDCSICDSRRKLNFAYVDIVNKVRSVKWVISTIEDRAAPPAINSEVMSRSLTPPPPPPT